MKLNQSYVTIVGRAAKFSLNENICIKRVISSPTFADIKFDSGTQYLVIYPHKTGRGIVELETADAALRLPIVAFAEREAFLITALSCNYHTGWNPALQDRLPHPKCCGPDKNGNAFIHIKNMERILHRCSLPITWFVDPPSVRQELDYFQRGIAQFGDEIAFMPSSFSHFNSVNYNLEKSYEETHELLRAGITALEEIFNRRITTVAIDQFIGSVGTNFTRAAAALGINALWGIGFDHYTCDTSMFHGGCPWNPYRPARENFRIPGTDPQPLWMFQWTFRDLINTIHTPGGASGAVMFSTDVDDILSTSAAAHQSDYYKHLAAEFLKNRTTNDMLIFTIHQEDHDSWNPAGCAYYERFFANLPQGFTPATMGEVAAWLDLKYPYPAEPSQTLRLEDPLTCKDAVKFIHPDVKKPPDWQTGGNLYPPHIFFYNRDFQIIFAENSPTPFRFINYGKKYSIPEKGVYPAENLPGVKVHSLKIVEEGGKSGIQYDLESDGDYGSYPLAIWTDETLPENSIAIPSGFVVFINLHKGRNCGFYNGLAV